MKKILSLILCLSMLLAFGSCNGEAPFEDKPESPTSGSTPEETPEETPVETPEETDENVPDETGLRYQAHRGVSTEFPENTIPAFQAAIDQGYKFIELDPNFTLDQRCVLMHDTTINRTCRLENGDKISGSDVAIDSISYPDLLQYDAGIVKGSMFKGTKVPLLSEVADLVAGTGVALKLDNKIQKFNDAQLEVIFTIAELSPDADIGFTCKTIEFVNKVVKRLPNATIHYDGYIDADVLNQLEALATDEREIYVWTKIDSAKDEYIKKIKEFGYLGIWILSTDEQLQKAIECGADVIETNGELKPPKAN